MLRRALPTRRAATLLQPRRLCADAGRSALSADSGRSALLSADSGEGSTEGVSTLKLYRDCMRLTYHIAAQVRSPGAPPLPRTRA